MKLFCFFILFFCDLENVFLLPAKILALFQFQSKYAYNLTTFANYLLLFHQYSSCIHPPVVCIWLAWADGIRVCVLIMVELPTCVPPHLVFIPFAIYKTRFANLLDWHFESLIWTCI